MRAIATLLACVLLNGTMAAIRSKKEDLALLYEAAFALIEQAKTYENSERLVQAKECYIKGIEKFLAVVEHEPDASKKKMIRESVATFLDKTEKIKERMNAKAATELDHVLNSKQEELTSQAAEAKPVEASKSKRNESNLYEDEGKQSECNHKPQPAEQHNSVKPRKPAVDKSVIIKPKHEEEAKENTDVAKPNRSSIETLVSMGFNKETAKNALVASNDNVELAAQYIVESENAQSGKNRARGNASRLGSKSAYQSPYAQKRSLNRSSHSASPSPHSNRFKSNSNNKKSNLEKRLGYKPSKAKPKKPVLSKQEQEIRDKLADNIIDSENASAMSFRDVQGLKNVKLALYETIILPSIRPDIFTGLREPTAGLLLFGPPGNGKTFIAKCVASECKATFFNISASAITSKWVGEGEKFMRGLFELAEQYAEKGKLSIIFIDEIDSLLTTRGSKNESESARRIKTEFLVQFDGVKKASQTNRRVLVIAATNLPWQLDDAVIRRFGKRICVPLPDWNTRKGLLLHLLDKQEGQHCLTQTEIDQVVAKTEDYSCSDLTGLCKDAAMGPVRDLGSNIVQIEQAKDIGAINRKHFEDALKNVKPSLNAGSLKIFEDWNEKYGSKIDLSNFVLPECMQSENLC